MKKPKRFFSLVISRRLILIVGSVITVLILASVSIRLFDVVQRRLFGVKPGVTLEGTLVSGLLEHELYDAVAGMAEGRYVEARNAVWDWQNSRVKPETVGQVIDINTTVRELLAAEQGENVNFVVVQVVPSITQEHFKPYYRGPDNTKKMSLMINVDWGEQFIPAMLETFEHYKVRATWFPTGRWAKKNSELLRKIASLGHEIGNHGGWHGMPTSMDNSEVKELIRQGETIIEEICGQKPTLFAPPAGDVNSRVVAIAGELGYKTVLWTIDTIDWQRPRPTTIIDRVVGRAANGAMVLMHPTEPTAQALPIIIDQLLREGYELTTVSSLLEGVPLGQQETAQ